jgi:hypothetical protein
MSPALTRRRFLSGAAGIVCGALAASKPGLAAEAGADLTASRFVSQVGRVFTAQALSASDAHVYAMRLRAVEPISRGAPGTPTALERERSFMLVFDVEESTAKQDTYRIANAETGEFAALLVPGRNPAVLTAVFNRAQ